MAHIHTEPGQHDLTVSAYIVRLDTPEPSMMLHMHRKLHMYLQFGGHVELDENPWQAIAHELLEESGYELANLRVLQPAQRVMQLSEAKLHPVPACVLTHPFTDQDHFHTDIAYAFTADSPPTGNVHEGESDDFKLLTAAELKTFPHGQIPENVREVSLFVLQTCLPTWQSVATADF